MGRLGTVRILVWLALASVGAGESAEAHPSFGRQVKAEESLCLRCHGNSEPVRIGGAEAPLLPEFFQMDWNMYEVEGEEAPPFTDLSRARAILPGKTFYDWSRQSMVEVYSDRCISIFPSGNDFACKFISRGARTYLAKYKRGDLSKLESCCRWTDGDFYAPRPDVLRNFSWLRRTEAAGRSTDWWWLDEPLPGPFGYGLDTISGEPRTFLFPVIGAWAQQNFFNFSSARPDQMEFNLPELCSEVAPVCE